MSYKSLHKGINITYFKKKISKYKEYKYKEKQFITV